MGTGKPGEFIVLALDEDKWAIWSSSLKAPANSSVWNEPKNQSS